MNRKFIRDLAIVSGTDARELEAAGKPRIQLDEEELQAVIDFHEGMARDAVDSCEFEEANRRRARAKELTELLRRTS